METLNELATYLSSKGIDWTRRAVRPETAEETRRSHADSVFSEFGPCQCNVCCTEVR